MARKGKVKTTVTRTTTWLRTTTTPCTMIPTTTMAPLVPLPPQTTLLPQAKAILNPDMEKNMESIPISDVVELVERRFTKTIIRTTTWTADLLVPPSDCPGQSSSTITGAKQVPTTGAGARGKNILGISF